MVLDKIRVRKEVAESEKERYEAPVVEKIEFDTQSTTVLGNCSGWKDGVMIE